MKRVCYLLILLFTLSGCSSTSTMVTIIDSNFQLKQAKSPLNTNVVEVKGQCYQDEYIELEFQQVKKDAFFLTLTNNHNSTIRILWDEAAFVDFNGYTHRINHDGSEMSKMLLNGVSTNRSTVHSTKGGYSRELSHGEISVVGTVEDTEKVQIPYVIPSKSRINTMVVPVGVGQIMRYANIGKMKFYDSSKAQQVFDSYRARSEHSAVRLILPFEIDGNTMEYTFVFREEFQMRQNDYLAEGNGAIILVPLSLLVLVLGLVV